MEIEIWLRYVFLLIYLFKGYAYMTEERMLIDHLFSKRHNFTELRPVINKSKVINVTFGVSYLQLCNLDFAEQILTSKILVRQVWKDEILVWDPKQYGNITEINLDPKLVWLPDLTLYNNAIPGYYSGSLYNFKFKVRVRYDGEVSWNTPVFLKSSCFVDVSWFPFDVQRCPLVFGSWSFHGYDVDINLDQNHADLTLYGESNNFKLIKAPASKRIMFYPCCAEPFPVLTYTIVFSRIPAYFFYNIILTLMLMVSISLMTFLTPPEYGKRIFLTIECFLTVVFISILMFRKLPKNSDSTPMLTTIINLSLILESFVLLSNVFTLNLSRPYRVPYIIRVILFQFIAPNVGLSDLQTFTNANTFSENRIHDLEILRKPSVYLKDRTIWHVIAQSMDRVFFLVFGAFYVLYIYFLFLSTPQQQWGKKY